MQRLEVNGAVQPIYGSLGVKRLIDFSASPLFVQLMRTNYYKFVKQLKSFTIIIVAPTCFDLHKPSSGSSQPVVHMQPQYG